MPPSRCIVTGLALLAVTGCGGGGGLKVAAGAADEAGRVVGGKARVELSAQQVDQVAQRAGVSTEVVEDVAPVLDTQPTWQRAFGQAQRIDAQTQGALRDVALGVACDGLQGRISSPAELQASLAGQVSGLTRPQFESLVRATTDLWSQLYAASTGTDPRASASAALTCYVLGLPD